MADAENRVKIPVKRVSLFRADCSNVDKADGKPEHNGLSSFGKVNQQEVVGHLAAS